MARYSEIIGGGFAAQNVQKEPFPERGRRLLGEPLVEPAAPFKDVGEPVYQSWWSRRVPSVRRQLPKARMILAGLDLKYHGLASDLAETHEGIVMKHDVPVSQTPGEVRALSEARTQHADAIARAQARILDSESA